MAVAESRRDRPVWILQEWVANAGREQRLTCAVDPSALVHMHVCVCVCTYACVCVYPRHKGTD